MSVTRIEAAAGEQRSHIISSFSPIIKNSEFAVEDFDRFVLGFINILGGEISTQPQNNQSFTTSHPFTDKLTGANIHFIKMTNTSLLNIPTIVVYSHPVKEHIQAKVSPGPQGFSYFKDLDSVSKYPSFISGDDEVYTKWGRYDLGELSPTKAQHVCRRVLEAYLRSSTDGSI